MTRVPLRWRWHRGMLALVVLLLPLTISLGLWQLQRAEEKRALLAEHESRSAMAPWVIDAGLPEMSEDLRYRRVTVTVRLDNDRVFLLDNRPRRGRQGYEVHTPAQVVDREGNVGSFWILVNRGWIETGLDREQLPAIPRVDRIVQLQGYLYQAPSEALLLADDPWPEDQWPLVVQSIDLGRVEGHLGVELPPYTLRLSPVNIVALDADWPIVVDGPAKHVGYAVQWFAMAAVLLALTVFANSNLLQVLTGGSRTTNEDRG